MTSPEASLDSPATPQYNPPMAKLKLSGMLVTRLDGRAGGLSWRPGEDTTGIVAKIPSPKTKGRAFRSHRLNPEFVTPDTLYADCDAWTAADAAYTALPPAAKAAWRDSIGRPGLSSYDVYMKSAIPHLLRGYPAPDYPHCTTGWPLDRLEFPDEFIHGRTQPRCTAIPPKSCQTEGLHFIGITWRRFTYLPDPDFYLHYEVRCQLGFNTGHAISPEAGYCQLDATASTDPTAEHWTTGSHPLPTTGIASYMPTRPAFAYVWVWPALRTLGPEPHPPLEEKDWDHLLKVYNLNGKELFTHWPRWWPSRKADSIPKDLSWITDWQDTPTHHYWPRGA